MINPAQILEPGLKESGLINFEKALNFANKYDWCTNKEYLKERESVIIDNFTPLALCPSHQRTRQY